MERFLERIALVFFYLVGFTIGLAFMVWLVVATLEFVLRAFPRLCA